LKEAIEVELNSCKKRKMFTDMIPTPPRIFPVEFKWIFIQKRNKNNEVVRYKARLGWLHKDLHKDSTLISLRHTLQL
jgi:hypothetical protein